MTAAAERWLRVAAALSASGAAEVTTIGLCRACAALLSVVGAAIVVIAGEGAVELAYASDGAIGALEELQFTLGVGPGLEAYDWGVPVDEDDLVAHPPERWPGFVGPAVAAGMRAMFSFPLAVGAARVGALSLYQDRAGPLDASGYADALVAAGFVTRALLGLQAGALGSSLAAELADNSVDRAEVHQASGMISAQLDVGVGEALTRLRAWAFTEGTTVRVAAAEVVARRTRFGL